MRQNPFPPALYLNPPTVKTEILFRQQNLPPQKRELAQNHSHNDDPSGCHHPYGDRDQCNFDHRAGDSWGLYEYR